MVSWDALCKPLPASQGGSIPLFRTDEPTPEVLGPLLGSPLQERPGHTTNSLTKDDHDD